LARHPRRERRDHGNRADDTIDALAGDDVVCGGSGNGTLIGGAGNDTIYGGAGHDTLIGDSEVTQGATFVYGNDLLIGASGNDQLYGDVVAQPYEGGLPGVRGMTFGYWVVQVTTFWRAMQGRVTTLRWRRDDVLYGGSGKDTLVGDVEWGGIETTVIGGNDIMVGGSGNDELFGDSVFLDDFLRAGTMSSWAAMLAGCLGQASSVGTTSSTWLRSRYSDRRCRGDGFQHPHRRDQHPQGWLRSRQLPAGNLQLLRTSLTRRFVVGEPGIWPEPGGPCAQSAARS
jgi:Ca2+-binding RTX toxin-like protein